MAGGGIFAPAMTPNTQSAVPALDPKAVEKFVSETWDKSIVPSITEYIAIPNKSPAFDKDWKKNGHMDRAVELIAAWCKARPIPGLKLEVVRLKNEQGEERTPVILMEIPGQTNETVLLYGHLDKQPEMGRMLLDELHVDIPADRVDQAHATAAQFSIEDHFPWAGSTSPMSVGTAEQLLARTWRPMLSVTGAGGLPPTGRAGNVLRPFTELRLSVRLPPTCDPERARQALAAALTSDPPYGATVAFEHSDAGPGWNAPPFAPWLDAAMTEASMIAFGQGPQAFGEGGSIPFMGMLGERFPDAQFVITGVLGPGANAHGPNEFLHLPTAERLTVCLAEVLRHHATR